MGTYPFEQMPTVVDTAVQAMNKAIDVAMVLIAQEGLSVIADNTPVDTTLAVSNWQVSTTSPLQSQIGPAVPNSKFGSGAAAARAVVKTRAAGKLTGARSLKNIYITNNVPYITVLEYGDSKHRPSGMVAKGLQAMALRASSIEIIK